MTHSYVWQDWCMNVGGCAEVGRCKCRALFSLVLVCHMSRMSHFICCFFSCVLSLYMTHSYSSLLTLLIICPWHTRLVWLKWVPIHMCDMTRMYVWQDSFLCVIWMIHTAKLACSDTFQSLTQSSKPNLVGLFSLKLGKGDQQALASCFELRAWCFGKCHWRGTGCKCDRIHSYSYHDTFKCWTWRIMCGMTCWVHTFTAHTPSLHTHIHTHSVHTHSHTHSLHTCIHTHSLRTHIHTHSVHIHIHTPPLHTHVHTHSLHSQLALVCYLTHMNDSCRTYKCVMAHISMKHTTCRNVWRWALHICIHIHIHIHTRMHTHTHTHTYTYAYTYTYTYIHTTCRNVWRWALHICMLYGVHMSAWW